MVSSTAFEPAAVIATGIVATVWLQVTPVGAPTQMTLSAADAGAATATTEAAGMARAVRISPRRTPRNVVHYTPKGQRPRFARVNRYFAGVGSVLPAASTART